MNKVKRLNIPSVGEDVVKLSYIASGSVKCYSYSCKQFGNILSLNIQLPYDPTTSFLGSYSKEINTYPQMMCK